MSRRFVIGVFTIVVILSSLIIYRNYFYVDFSRMNFFIGQGAYKSQDGYYIVEIGIYPVGEIPPYLKNQNLLPYILENDIESYVVGYLRWDPEFLKDGPEVWSGSKRKLIFFEEYEGSNITVVWKNNSTVIINDIELHLPYQTYDYRRFW